MSPSTALRLVALVGNLRSSGFRGPPKQRSLRITPASVSPDRAPSPSAGQRQRGTGVQTLDGSPNRIARSADPPADDPQGCHRVARCPKIGITPSGQPQNRPRLAGGAWSMEGHDSELRRWLNVHHAAPGLSNRCVAGTVQLPVTSASNGAGGIACGLDLVD